LTYAEEQFGVAIAFEEFLKREHRGSMKRFLEDRRRLAKDQNMEILLASRIEIPNIYCPKSMRSLLTEDCQIVPVAIKRDSTPQKFRLPLKYKGLVELEVEFFFKSSQAIN
jgi:hypothetical protein